MRRWFAFAFAVSVSGCGQVTPTAPDAVVPLQAPESAAPADVAGRVTAATVPRGDGVDNVGGTCDTATWYHPNISDEINSAADVDAYVWKSDAGLHFYTASASGTYPPLDCAVSYRDAVGTWLPVGSAQSSNGTCSVSFIAAAPNLFCFAVRGTNGAYGPASVPVMLFG